VTARRRATPPRRRRPPPRTYRRQHDGHDDAGLPPLCDIDANLAVVARARLKADVVTRGTVQLSDSMTENMLRHFAPEEAETAGRALIVAASHVLALLDEARRGGNDLNPAVVLNLFGFTGARLVTDGRAWSDAAGRGDPS
jgi:hypothetical protein